MYINSLSYYSAYSTHAIFPKRKGKVGRYRYRQGYKLIKSNLATYVECFSSFPNFVRPFNSQHSHPLL